MHDNVCEQYNKIDLEAAEAAITNHDHLTTKSKEYDEFITQGIELESRKELLNYTFSCLNEDIDYDCGDALEQIGIDEHTPGDLIDNICDALHECEDEIQEHKNDLEKNIKVSMEGPLCKGLESSLLCWESRSLSV